MRFLWKLYVGYMSLVLLTTAVVGLLVTRWLAEDSLQETGRQLHATALLLQATAREDLRGGTHSQLQAKIDQTGRDLQSRLTVIAPDGVVLADSRRDPTQLDNHANRPEVVEARRTGHAGHSTRFSHSVQKMLMYEALPVLEDGQLRGYVRAAIPLDVIEGRRSQLRSYVLLGALIAAAMALIPGLYFARRVTEPLRSMTEAAGALAIGDYTDFQTPRGSRDEIGALAEAFGNMAAQLRDRLHTIESDRTRLAAILAAMVEGVIAIDREGRVVHMNEVAARILEIDPDQVGEQIGQVTGLAEVSEAFSHTIEQVESTRSEVSLEGARTIQLQVAPLRDASGVTGAVMVLHDVTQLRRLGTMRRDFVGNVSHELKTPLTAITGLIETLLDDPDMPPPTRQRFLEKVRNQGHRLAALVADLLTLSRVETEEEALDMRRLDLRIPAAESVQELAAQADAKGLQLETSLPPDAVFVRGDREALRQVVDNLLSNAIRYTPSGGKVWVRLLVEDESALLEVEDTGIGLAPKHQERIFERFYRVDKARSRELGGTGLGLSIVKHVVLAHQGGVSVESRPNQGSTFRVRLPLLVGELVSSEVTEV